MEGRRREDNQEGGQQMSKPQWDTRGSYFLSLSSMSSVWEYWLSIRIAEVLGAAEGLCVKVS